MFRKAFLAGDRPATLHGVVFDILVGSEARAVVEGFQGTNHIDACAAASLALLRGVGWGDLAPPRKQGEEAFHHLLNPPPLLYRAAKY
jgi:hypothetical protein